jgi:hypothetical protein
MTCATIDLHPSNRPSHESVIENEVVSPPTEACYAEARRRGPRESRGMLPTDWPGRARVPPIQVDAVRLGCCTERYPRTQPHTMRDWTPRPSQAEARFRLVLRERGVEEEASLSPRLGHDLLRLGGVGVLLQDFLPLLADVARPPQLRRQLLPRQPHLQSSQVLAVVHPELEELRPVCEVLLAARPRR